MAEHIHIYLNRTRDAGFEESKHKRDKGKFSSTAGAKGAARGTAKGAAKGNPGEQSNKVSIPPEKIQAAKAWLEEQTDMSYEVGEPITNAIKVGSAGLLNDYVHLSEEQQKAAEAKAPEMMVDASKLLSVQQELDPSTLEYFLDHPEEINKKPALLVHGKSGQIAIADGNHRASAALLLGIPLRTKIMRF